MGHTHLVCRRAPGQSVGHPRARFAGVSASQLDAQRAGVPPCHAPRGTYAEAVVDVSVRNISVCLYVCLAHRCPPAIGPRASLSSARSSVTIPCTSTRASAWTGRMAMCQTTGASLPRQ